MAGNTLETSEPSISQTLGSTDTCSGDVGTVEESTGINKSNIPKPKGNLKTPWVDLFKPSCEKGKEVLHLSFYEPVNGGALIEDNELLVIKELWAFALLGCFAGRFPGVTAIQALVDSWKIECKWNIQPNDHVLFRFNTEEDRCKVLSNGSYSLFGKPLFLKTLPEHFHLDNNDFSTLPIWVQFPSLPSEFWGPVALSKIASCIGKPLWSDDTTKAMKKGGYARVLVEIDTSFHPLEAIPVSTPGGYSFSQDVFYELPPCFCTKCRSNDHYKDECNGNWRNKRRGRKSVPPKGRRGKSKRPSSNSVGRSNLQPPAGLSTQSSDPPVEPPQPVDENSLTKDGTDHPATQGVEVEQETPPAVEQDVNSAVDKDTPAASPESDVALTQCVNDDEVDPSQDSSASEPSSPTPVGTASNLEISPIGSNTKRGRNVLQEQFAEVFNETNVDVVKKKAPKSAGVGKTVAVRGVATKNSKVSLGYKAALLSPTAEQDTSSVATIQGTLRLLVLFFAQAFGSVSPLPVFLLVHESLTPCDGLSSVLDQVDATIFWHHAGNIEPPVVLSAARLERSS
nr:uncharacterized protein LOC111395991 [Ipomoea trifida]